MAENLETSDLICTLEAVVYYVDPKVKGSLSFLGGKERIRVPLRRKDMSLEALKLHLKEFAGIKVESEKRGLGSTVELKLCRLTKSQEQGSKAYSINTQAQWDVERPLICQSSVLQVNVLKKEVVFAKGSPVVRIIIADGEKVEKQHANKRKPGGGRKRSVSKQEDANLVKRMKTGEVVSRNERQTKMLEELNKELESMSNSTATNEFTVRCGGCGKLKIVPIDRTPQAKAQYFKKRHYDNACLNIQRLEENVKKDSSMIAGMKQNMAAFLNKRSDTQGEDEGYDKPQEETARSGIPNEYDSDRDIDLDDILQENVTASANEFAGNIQYDSDREVGTNIVPEMSSDCLTGSEQSSQISDNNDFSDSDDIDTDYLIFPISFEKADDVCIRLNELIQAGRIPKDKILYKYLDSMTCAMINPNHQFDEEVVEFFNSIKYLGGERTANFVRGPMWHGCGKGGTPKPECAKPNLGGPSRTTRNKRSSGYTTNSGIIKPWLNSFLRLANDSLDVNPLIQTPILKVYGVAMENDGTALKPAIQYDDIQQVNVGLKEKVDIRFVNSNPNPKPEFLKKNIVTEANVTYISTADNNVAMPVSVRYVPKGGKSGEEMKQQFLDEVGVVQTCHSCVNAAVSKEHVLTEEATAICNSFCENCAVAESVCADCKEKGQTSHIPPLRACQRCIEAGQQCVRAAVLVVATDCESGNKKAFQLIAECRAEGRLNAQFIFTCLPDAVHVGKSLKCNFANWMILLLDERACLSMINTIRNSDPQLKKILPRDSVMNKDRMNVDCVLHLSKENVLSHLEGIGHVVHSIVPDSFRISETNKPGLYPHPISVCVGEHGKLLVLDYAPMKNSSRLLEVRLHVPADIKILGEYSGATSMVYSDGIAFLCQPSGFQAVSVAKKLTLQPKKLKKAELINELQQRGLSPHGTVPVLKERLEMHLKNLESTYRDQKIDLTKVHLSRNIEPTCVTKASDSILMCSSDSEQAIYSIMVELDGVAVKGNVTLFSKYPNGCEKVISMCVNNNMLYVSHKGHPGGVAAINMSDLTVEMVLQNGSEGCAESTHVAPYREGIVFVDTDSHQIKEKSPREDVTVIAGNGSGREGNTNGKAENASFSQPMGICVECDKNIFVTDAQTGSVKVVTTIKGTVQFLRHLGLLYKAFSVHLKHQKVQKLSLNEAINHLETVDTFLKDSTEKVIATLHKPSKPKGAIGTISSQTLSSVGMINDGLQALSQQIMEINPSYRVDLYSCLTVQVENLHAVGHFKDQFPSLLQYARNLSNTVYESIKRVVNWAAYYYTHETSYYPVVPQATPLSALPRMSHLKPTRKLSDKEKAVMLEWASHNGKALRQRSVRQETTMFKAGTLPLNMYATSNEEPKEKISLERRPTQPVLHNDSNLSPGDGRCEEEMSEHGSVESIQISEYDTDSETEDPVAPADSDSDDEMTFLRAITTRSGRTVRVSSKL